MSTLSTPGAALDYTNLPVAKGQEPTFGGLTASAWVKILIVTGLLVALFRFNLARLWSKTNPFTGDANWGHTPIIPLIGLYFLYLNRDHLLGATVKPIFLERVTRVRLIVSLSAIAAGVLGYFSGGAILAAIVGVSDTIGNIAGSFGLGLIIWGALMLALGWGLGNLIFGLLVFAYGIYPGQNDWLKDYGMVHTIFGTVLTLCGWQIMRVGWFPIAYLICGIPWPGLVYSWVANPLQNLAARVTVATLNVTGIQSFREGTKMFITRDDGTLRQLNVVEACAGMRSLMTFIAVGAAVAFLSWNRAFWQKVVITASAVPIAVFCNVCRVTVQAYLDRLAGPQWSENFAHQFVGLVMLIPAFFLIMGVAWIIDHLFVEEVSDKSKIRAAAKNDKKIIVAKTVAVQTESPAAPPRVATQPKPSPAASVRVPPRQNLTGKPSSRPTEGA